MTVSIITACGGTGFLSLDTLHYSYHQFAPLDIPQLDGTPETAFRAVWCGDGKPPKVDALDFSPKVHAQPRLKMAIGYAGFSAVGMAWVDFVQRANVTCVEDLDDIAPAILPQIAAQFTGHTDAAVFHLGWSEREQQVVGRMFRTFNGFQAEEFANCTVLGTPVHPEFDGHDAIISAVDVAARGEEVEAFHVAIT